MAFSLAAAIRWALIPIFGLALPYITFYPAIMVSAWYGGLGPGVPAELCATIAELRVAERQ